VVLVLILVLNLRGRKSVGSRRSMDLDQHTNCKVSQAVEGATELRPGIHMHGDSGGVRTSLLWRQRKAGGGVVDARDRPA
jgi:hypothetical protein